MDLPEPVACGMIPWFVQPSRLFAAAMTIIISFIKTAIFTQFCVVYMAYHASVCRRVLISYEISVFKLNYIKQMHCPLAFCIGSKSHLQIDLWS